MEERAWESGHIQLKYIIFLPKPWSSRNTSADREIRAPFQNVVPEPSVLQGAMVVIGDRLCSSDWNTEAILLKDFKDMKLNFKDNKLSAADSIMYVASLWAGMNM